MNLFEITVDQHMDLIEYAGNMLERHDLFDSSVPGLVDVSIHEIFHVWPTNLFPRNENTNLSSILICNVRVFKGNRH